MPSFIPFVNSKTDTTILKKHYSDAPMCRVGLHVAEKLASLVAGIKLWIDPVIDGYHRLKAWPTNQTKMTEWEKLFSSIPRGDKMFRPGFVARPPKEDVQKIVYKTLDRCKLYNPTWLSVPQLPFVNDNSRNKINKMLAELTQRWKSERGFRGRLILPVIFTNRAQYRTGRAEQIKRILVRLGFGASGIWIVDQNLNDQAATENLDKRLGWLVNFHDELAEELQHDVIRIGGPYWGMNLVLWARGLINYSAINLGRSYQYRDPNSKPKHPPTDRVALEPLRRWGMVAGLDEWLRKASMELAEHDPARGQFLGLTNNLRSLELRGRTQWQVAEVYRNWLNSLEEVPQSGRAVTLYQQFSSAVVVGSSLPDLPPGNGSGRARRPDIVAKQLMFNCL